MAPKCTVYCLVAVLSVVQMDVSGKKEADRSTFITKEMAFLEKTTSCNFPTVTRKVVHGSWLKDKAADETVLCILKQLQTSLEDGFVWAMVGTSFDKRGSKQKADFCFKQSAKLSGKHSVFIKEWSYAAPFVIGKSEFDGDPLHAFGGIANASKFRFDSKPAPKFFSELSPNGVIKWEVTRQSKAGDYVQIRPPIDWNDLVTSLGSLGITEWQGWAVGDLEVKEDNIPLAVQCLGVPRCIVGETTIIGDLYHRDYFWSPISLRRGVYPVFVPMKTKVAMSFKFSLSSKLSSFTLFQPKFLPDIYDRYLPNEAYISVPVSNRMIGKWLKVTKVEVVRQSEGKAIECQLVDTINHVAPGQTRPVTVQLSTADGTSDGNSKLLDACIDVELELKFRTSEGHESLKLTLRCRNKGSSFLYTFIDHDGSVQHAAAIEPLGKRSTLGDPCPVVLSLHGTTVPPQNQADSYKKMVDGEFQFGVKGMWLLAPTRHGAHNWEGPGTLTALWSLETLRKLSQDKVVFRLEADPSRVVFAGHSMGGHGAWQLATHFPDRAIAVVSLAGWITKEEYGDSNLFFRHDTSNSFVDPALKAIMEASVAENDVDKHARNLKGIPVLARIGGNDRTVHPYFVRRMVRVLKSADVDVTYSELPGLEHWWWDTKETNDGGCVNDGQIRKFFDQVLNQMKLETPTASPQKDSCSRENAEECGDSDSSPSYVLGRKTETETATLVVVNPALGEGLKGVTVLQQLVPFRTSTVEMHRQGESVWFVTRNIGCLQIKEASVPNRSWDLHNLKSLEIDGFTVGLGDMLPPYILCRFNRNFPDGEMKWQHVPDLYSEKSAVPARGPDNYGPARRVAEQPFLIVVGTKAGTSTSSILLQHAVYIANQFFATSETLVPIVEDADLDEATIGNKNLIIIGSPKENFIAGQFVDFLPDLNLDFISEPILKLGATCQYTSPSTGILALAPHGPRNLVLLLMGISTSGLNDVVKLATPTIPPMARSPFSNLLPDYVITGPDTGLKGPGGFLCAGFWDNTWRFSEKSASCVCGA